MADFSGYDLALLTQAQMNKALASTETYYSPNINAPISGIGMRSVGEAAVGSLMDLANKVPAPRVAKEMPINLKVVKRDKDTNRPTKSISWHPNAKSWRRTDWEQSSAETAAQLVNGELPTGYFVVSDWVAAEKALRGRDVQHGERETIAKRGAFYEISAKPASSNTSILKMKLLGAGSEYTAFEGELPHESIKKVLGATRPLDKNGLSMTKTQMAVLKHRMTLDMLYKLRNPAAFEEFVSSGRAPAMVASGVEGLFLPGAQRLFERATAMGQIESGKVYGSVLSLFRQAAFSAYGKAPGNTLKEAMKKDPKFAEFANRSFSRFISPVLDRATTTVLNPINPDTAQTGGEVAVLRGSAVRPGTILEMIKERMRTSQLGNSQVFNSLLKADLTQTPDINYIHERLSMLDEADLSMKNMTSGYMIAGERISQNRVESFARLQKRLADMVNVKGVEGKFDIHYNFEDAQPRSGIGMGIRVSIVPKRQGAIGAGERGVAQFFLPVLDNQGKFTTETGGSYLGRLFGVSGAVHQNAKYALWNDDLSLVSQGTSRMKPAFQKGKGLASGLVYSTQQLFTAAIDQRFPAITSALKKNNLETVTMEANRAINKVYSDYGAGVALSDIPTHNEWVIRRSISMPDQFIVNPLDLAATKASWVTQPDKFEAFTENRMDLLAPGSHPISVGIRAKLTELYNDLANSFGGENVAKNLYKSLGANLSYQTRRSREAREFVSRSLGLDIAGRGPDADDAPLDESVFRHGMPFGNSEVRPVQPFNSVPLYGGASRVASTPFLQTAGYEQLSDPEYVRNMRVGFVTGGQFLDEEGNPTGRVLTDEETLQVLGAHEQQMIMKKSAQQEFGYDANMTNQKLMADMSKGTVQIAEDHGISWSDPIQMWTGVPLGKTIEKHQSLNTIVRGTLGRILSEAGEDRSTIKERLEKILGDVRINETISGMLSAKIGRSTVAPTLDELRDLLIDINAGRTADKQISINRMVDVTLGNGARMRVSAVDVLLSTRVIADASHDTAYNARERMYEPVARLPIKSRAQRRSMGSIDLMRMKSEGLGMHAYNIALSDFNRKYKTGKLYNTAQMIEAHLFMDEPGSSVSEENLIPLNSLVHRTQTVPNNRMTEQEYKARYGTGEGTKYFNYKGSIVPLPDEIPKPGEMVSPSKVQMQADRVITAAMENNNTAFAEAMQRYRGIISSELEGKEGLVNKLLRKITVEGQGAMKGPLAQSTMLDRLAGFDEIPGTTQSLNPFEAMVSREFAENIGAVQPSIKSNRLKKAKEGSGLADFRNEVENRGFFYGSIHRDPNVVLGRMGAKFIINDQLQGNAIYVHDSLREALIGDSDGDKVGVILAGYLEGTKPTKKAIADLEAQFENEIQRKADTWHRAIAAKVPEEGTMLDGINATFDFFKTKLMKANPAWGEAGRYLHKTSEEQAMLVNQRGVQAGQGIMGSMMDPIQEHMQRMLSQAVKAGDTEAASRYALLSDAAGNMREEVLKVKSGKIMDPFTLQQGILGSPAYGQKRVGEMTVTDLNQMDKETRKALIQSQSEDLKKVMSANFIEPYIGKNDKKAAMYQSFLDYVLEQRANKPNWYNEQIKGIQTDEYGEITNIASSGLLAEGLGNNPKPDKLRFSLKNLMNIFSGNEQPGPSGTAENYLRLIQDSMKEKVSDPIRQAVTELVENNKDKTIASVPVANIPDVEDITKSMISATAPSSAKEVAGVTMVRENPAFKETIAKVAKNPWAIAGAVGLGLVALRGSTFQSGGGQGFDGGRDLPTGAPVVAPSGKTRVLSEQSAQSYNVRVTAKDDKNQSGTSYGKAAGIIPGNSTVNVNVQDDRRKMADYSNQQLLNQLRGR